MNTKHKILFGVLCLLALGAAGLSGIVFYEITQRLDSKVETTVRATEVYSSYQQVISEHGHYGQESAIAAGEAARLIRSISDSENALAYTLLTIIAIDWGAGAPASILVEGYENLLNTEALRFLKATKRHWDIGENERMNAAIVALNEERSLQIRTIPLVPLKLEVRENLQRCLEHLQDRLFGEGINFNTDLLLNRKDCPSNANASSDAKIHFG